MSTKLKNVNILTDLSRVNLARSVLKVAHFADDFI